METSKARPLFQRIASSLAALAIAWLSVAAAFGIYSRSAYAVVACLISTLFIFAIAWIVVGIPSVAAGRLLVQMPTWVAGFLGAVAGLVILFTVDRADNLYRPENLFGFPTLAAFSGAAGMVVYRLLIATKTKH